MENYVRIVTKLIIEELNQVWQVAFSDSLQQVFLVLHIISSLYSFEDQ